MRPLGIPATEDKLLQLAERIDDEPFLRLIKKWLTAGVLDTDGQVRPESGTPQGGIVSPVLANVYLHAPHERGCATH